jgi:anti-anti-sigma regulatory factor
MSAQRGRRTWAETSTRLSVRRLGYALVVTAAGDMSDTDSRAWADLVTAACLSRARAAMVVVDLTGVTALTPLVMETLGSAVELCSGRRDLRVLARGVDEEVLRQAGLDHLVTAAGMLHRAVSGPRSG